MPHPPTARCRTRRVEIHQRPTGEDAFLCALYSSRATERNPPLRSRTVRTQFVDCRWELGAPERGRELYLAGHIPGASFLDVDQGLSDLSVPDAGRHPLPPADAFAAAVGHA